MTEQSIGNRKETMTKIILAFPCMGKTYYAQNHPAKVLDLESSDYFFDKTGYEHLTSEEFKGIPNRKLKENGLADYLKAIDEAVKSGKYDYLQHLANMPLLIRDINNAIINQPEPLDKLNAILEEFDDYYDYESHFDGTGNGSFGHVVENFFEDIFNSHLMFNSIF